jgi:preprotein translocase subunit SecG
MFQFLLIVQTLVAAAMVAVILMQRSEGGGLGVGGSPSGLMSARGAADFLTRATAVLATIFVVLSIALAGLATLERAPIQIDPNAARRPAPAAPLQPGPAVLPGQAPPVVDPLAGAAEQAAGGNGAAAVPAAPVAPAAPANAQ